MRKLVNMRLPEGLLTRLDGRAKELGQTRTAFVERMLERALGNGEVAPAPASTPSDRPAPPRISIPKKPPKTPKKYERPKNLKTSGRRTPPRPQPRTEPGLPVWTGPIIEGQKKGGNAREGEEPDVLNREPSVGCAECGGDIAVHPEFGRYCTGCGARVR